MTPLVSVAIKAYNHAPFVAQAIESILGQTFGDFEIVITDDGSTDATPDIIASFHDERIRFERSPRNQGASRAMNATVARARGEFVAILNSDDFALPTRLETQVAFLRAHAEIAGVFDVPHQVGEFGEAVAGFGSLFDIPFDHPQPSRQEWLRRFFFYGNCLCAPSAMIRRAALAEIGDDDPRLTVLLDLDRWVRLLERHEIHVMNQRLTAFRVRPDGGNASAGNRTSHLRGAFEFSRILRRYRSFDPQLLREIFAGDIAQFGIDTDRATDLWFAEIARFGGHPAHPLLMLETLFDAARSDADFARLRELTGLTNALRIDVPGT